MCVDAAVQADPKQARRKDDDGRLPIHWAASSNQHDIVMLLTQQKGFDPDVEVSKKGHPDALPSPPRTPEPRTLPACLQDDSGWTPLMIAVSVKDNEKLVELLLSRGADVNQASESAV